MGSQEGQYITAFRNQNRCTLIYGYYDQMMMEQIKKVKRRSQIVKKIHEGLCKKPFLPFLPF